MFKKLQNLLFEEEEVVEEEVIDEPEEDYKPVKPVKKAKPVHVVEEKQVVEPVKAQPVIQESVHETVKVPEPVVEEEKPKTLGLSVDDLQEGRAPVVEPVAQEKAKVVTTHVKPKMDRSKIAYEFTPVISPIFGVEEKDVDAVIPTKQGKKKASTDSKVAGVISPMYGLELEPEKEEVVEVTAPVLEPKVDTTSAENDVPVFSLDDILNVRDSAYSNTNNDTSGETKIADVNSFFKTENEDVDKTVVMNSRNISLFDDDEE